MTEEAARSGEDGGSGLWNLEVGARADGVVMYHQNLVEPQTALACFILGAGGCSWSHREGGRESLGAALGKKEKRPGLNREKAAMKTWFNQMKILDPHRATMFLDTGHRSF